MAYTSWAATLGGCGSQSCGTLSLPAQHVTCEAGAVIFRLAKKQLFQLQGRAGAEQLRRGRRTHCRSDGRGGLGVGVGAGVGGPVPGVRSAEPDTTLSTSLIEPSMLAIEASEARLLPGELSMLVIPHCRALVLGVDAAEPRPCTRGRAEVGLRPADRARGASRNAQARRPTRLNTHAETTSACSSVCRAQGWSASGGLRVLLVHVCAGAQTRVSAWSSMEVIEIPSRALAREEPDVSSAMPDFPLREAVVRGARPVTSPSCCTRVPEHAACQVPNGLRLAQRWESSPLSFQPVFSDIHTKRGVNGRPLP